MRLVYVGTHDAVDVIDAGVIATRDVPIEITDKQVALSLLEQDSNWAKAPSGKTTTKDGS